MTRRLRGGHAASAPRRAPRPAQPRAVRGWPPGHWVFVGLLPQADLKREQPDELLAGERAGPVCRRRAPLQLHRRICPEPALAATPADRARNTLSSRLAVSGSPATTRPAKAFASRAGVAESSRMASAAGGGVAPRRARPSVQCDPVDPGGRRGGARSRQIAVDRDRVLDGTIGRVEADNLSHGCLPAVSAGWSRPVGGHCWSRTTSRGRARA